MKRPTPETDAECGGPLSGDDTWPSVYISADFARNLERQRDEVRELARELRNALEAILDWEPRQKDEVERIAYKLGRESLTKAKEVLGEV